MSLSNVGLAEENPADFDHYCGAVWVQRGFKLKLETMERRLVCGDDKDDSIGKPWATIPANEASYFLRSFLQSRGYHQPDFEFVAEAVYVRPGPISKLTSFQLAHLPSSWKAPKKRAIYGHLLTPKLLDELEQWTRTQLRTVGYACAQVAATANPLTGEVVVDAESGELKRILSIDDKDATGLRAKVLSRYHAFFVGDYYNERLVELTRRRIINSGVVQSVEMTPVCDEDGVHIIRHSDPGLSRQFSIGFGGSTDEGPRIRTSMQQSRIGSMGSSAQATASVSYRVQEADSSLRWFYSHNYVNSFIEPAISFERQNELLYQSETFDAHIYHGWGVGFFKNSMTFKLGPEYVETYERDSLTPGYSTLNLLVAQVDWTDYNWEYFQASPRMGFSSSLGLIRAQKGLGNDFNAQKVTLKGEHLWNLGDYDPPLFIIGVRGYAGSTFLEDTNLAQQMPLQFRFYAGGSTDVRGFSRQSLPMGDQNALSELTESTEIRMYKVIYETLDPFIFLDAGKLGRENFTLNSSTFLSPGLGLRWESFIGSLRAYAAKPIIQNPQASEVGYRNSIHLGITLGEEF